ncbi:thermonuclease family protein [Microbacterium ureisolvens]|uniref:thermonuclease family protein n=1 Tax=Microbacterium ureisolvens TaxID=2781186 RepID=UPI003631AC2B
MRDDSRPGSRRRHRWDVATAATVVVGVVVFVLAIAWPGEPGTGADAPWQDDSRLHRRMPLPRVVPSPTAVEPAPGGDQASIPPRPTHAFALTVTHVYDGDTIEAQVVQPNDIVTTTDPIRIRLIGIDTPEGTPTPECWADEARTHLSELLAEGSTFWAAPDVDTWDDYDRRLLHVWTYDGRFVSHELVAAGDAEVMRVEPNVAYADLLAAAQAEAEASGIGLWTACP